MGYLDLFISFVKIGLFSFGGGMGAIPLIQDQVVTHHGWLTLNDFTDLISIAEMTPGPIAINASTFVGMRLYGIPGALIATTGCILPACFIVSTLGWLYFKYKNLACLQIILAVLRPVIVALITIAGISIFKLLVFSTGFNIIGLVLMLIGFFLLKRFKLSPITVMFFSGIIGGGLYMLNDHFHLI